MADFNPNPYRGEASIPHVSEDFFKIYFAGAQVNLTWMIFIIADFYEMQVVIRSQKLMDLPL